MEGIFRQRHGTPLVPIRSYEPVWIGVGELDPYAQVSGCGGRDRGYRAQDPGQGQGKVREQGRRGGDRRSERGNVARGSKAGGQDRLL